MKKLFILPALIAGLAALPAGRVAAQTVFAFTQPVGPVTPLAATLNGMIQPSNSLTLAWFEWGTNNSYGFTTSPQSVGTGNGVVRVSAPVSNLVAGASYHYRVVASNSVGVVAYGADGQFTTGMKVAVWGDSFSGNRKVPAGLTNIVTIACGHGHSLAIQSDSTMAAWGGYFSYPVAGQTNVPVGLSNVVAIAGGYSSSLAVRADGTVAAWGKFMNNQTNFVPAGLSNVVAVAAGDDHCLALKADGTIRVWGSNGSGQTNVPAGTTNIVAITSGATHSLALKANGTVVAWGDNTYGQKTVPAGLQGVVAISSEVFHNLALKSDGTVVAWGLNANGQTTVPTGLSNVVAVAAGDYHSSALKSDGSVVIWGDNSSGQKNLPPGLSNIVAIANGDFHCMALAPNAPPQQFPQKVTGLINSSFPVTLQGSDPNGDPLTFRIATLPASGALYQYTNGGSGDPITVADSPVSDSLGRVIFTPAPDMFGAPYTSFNIVANDGQFDSPPGTVTVNVITAPVLNPTGFTPAPNRTFVMNFAGFSNVTYQAWASTNLSNWTLLGNCTQPVPGQFQFTDTAATNWPTRFYRVRAL